MAPRTFDRPEQEPRPPVVGGDVGSVSTGTPAARVGISAPPDRLLVVWVRRGRTRRHRRSLFRAQVRRHRRRRCRALVVRHRRSVFRAQVRRHRRRWCRARLSDGSSVCRSCSASRATDPVRGVTFHLPFAHQLFQVGGAGHHVLDLRVEQQGDDTQEHEPSTVLLDRGVGEAPGVPGLGRSDAEGQQRGEHEDRARTSRSPAGSPCTTSRRAAGTSGARSRGRSRASPAGR